MKHWGEKKRHLKEIFKKSWYYIMEHTVPLKKASGISPYYSVMILNFNFESIFPVQWSAEIGFGINKVARVGPGSYGKSPLSIK